MKQIWVVFVLAAVALAGCSDDGSAEGKPMDHSGPNAMGGDSSMVTAAPVWAVGDWWSYKATDGKTYNIIVAENNGGDWEVLTNDLSLALVDFQLDISFIGKIRKSDLAGAQGSDRIQFFDFPLTHGKTWSTPWDGATRQIVSHAAVGGTWHISVSDAAGAKFADYVYDPSVGFFDSLNFYNTTSGDVQYGTENTGSGSDFSGSAYRYTEVIAAVDLTQVGPGGPAGELNIGAEINEFVVDTTIDCQGPGIVGIGMQEPQDDGSAQPTPPLLGIFGSGVPTYGMFGDCPNGAGVYQEVVTDPKLGTYRYDGVVANQGGFHFVVTTRSYATLNF